MNKCWLEQKTLQDRAANVTLNSDMLSSCAVKPELDLLRKVTAGLLSFTMDDFSVVWLIDKVIESLLIV